mmetsp:Transcript_15932/g.24923  ORF Transcript_15932/g.24923 Transcript_15932/m.24923 type:complete len:209 (-) Transcript_15932:64-690(-)
MHTVHRQSLRCFRPDSEIFRQAKPKLLFDPRSTALLDACDQAIWDSDIRIREKFLLKAMRISSVCLRWRQRCAPTTQERRWYTLGQQIGTCSTSSRAGSYATRATASRSLSSGRGRSWVKCRFWRWARWGRARNVWPTQTSSAASSPSQRSRFSQDSRSSLLDFTEAWLSRALSAVCTRLTHSTCDDGNSRRRCQRVKSTSWTIPWSR